MKKSLISILSFFLLTSLLFTSACTSAGVENGSETDSNVSSESNAMSESSSKESDSEKTDKPEAETEKTVYTDLSGDFDPRLPQNNEKKVQATATGSEFTTSFVLNFDGKEENYSFESFGLSGLHDSYSCNNCTYVEKNGTTAFHTCDHSGAHSGITVILKTPIKADLVTSVKFTFMTADEIKNASQLRIQSGIATNASDVVNLDGCPDISGAVDNWKTADFGFNSSHVSAIADSDGYIRSFKFYFRDKDDTEIFIKNISFELSINNLCTVSALRENSFSSGHALQSIADIIVENLSAEGISADIELRCSDYQPSTSTKSGSLTYKAIITTKTDKITLNSVTTLLKKTEGEWLPINSEFYETARDSLEQWKTGFDKSGILCLENNLLKAAEKLEGVEYAVIAKDADLTDKNVVWFAPQLLEIRDDGINKLFINAYLDYGNKLTEGTDYRFVVRGVTENQNYILHLDIPFSYSPISNEAISAIENAANAIKDLDEAFIFADTNRKEAVKASIEEMIGNEMVTVNIKTVADGVHSGRYEISLSYSEGIDSKRYPAYTLGGVSKNDFFAYTGCFYSYVTLVNYSTIPKQDIYLTAPYDGEEGIRIASDDVVRFWEADLDLIITNLHDYGIGGELCDPVPVRLEWNGSGEGEYNVKISEFFDLSDAWSFTTSEEFYDVYNLKSGTRYYWRVEQGDAVSMTYTFITEDGYPRYILSDKVSNFRDIGGHLTTDGKKVKQGVAFRFSNFDSVSSADKAFINGCLGIRTELDLRGERSTSPLGSGVQALPISVKWYSGIFAEGESEPIRKAIAVFADADNYPIGYHCAIGRDRTGTVTILILGLLGVDEETILRDYMISMLSVSGRSNNPSSLYSNYKSLIDGLDKFGDEDDSFKDKVEAYLLSIGITEEEIASIRANLLED